MVRHDIEFDAEGALLRGWFYEPDPSDAPAPCVVMAHGWTSTKHMYLDRFAEVFAEAGLAVLVFDNRGWGDSEAAPGNPRHEIDPWEQIRDYQHAITYAQNRPEVDPDRIGVWGTSFSAGHAFVVAAIDRRVKAVSGQAPFISGRATYATIARVHNQLVGPEIFTADRRARAAGEPPVTMPVVGDDPGQLVGLPTPDSYAYFTHARETLDPAWPNEVTLRSLEHVYGYEPGRYLSDVTPTPLRMIVGREDGLTGGNLAASAFETAAEPKKIVFLPGGHFAAYTGDGFARASGASRDWFLEHLTR
ncbi:alpha/beta hydrolase [Streptomyces thermodiastaticus]|uniref:alpha/beta hydrolase n=1 Tax=Streptomyces thermodiastaticus TaxID=44061 RepID=UPI0016727727|nr:alpha/beta fold hydrolase [Streptomyces thermodiastaticus]MCE7548602.1 alpha/beta fold hydrolase [Streptomyces thermodiastaticus]GHF81686.1 peptidase [Streptomyces thermodiastaticus]